MARPAPAAPPPGRSAVSPRCGTRPAPCNAAAMSGWCRTRCPACRATTLAAQDTSTAAAAAWMSFRPTPFCGWSIKRSPIRRSPSELFARARGRLVGACLLHGRRLERRIGLLVAVIDHDGEALIDDVVALDEN